MTYLFCADDGSSSAWPSVLVHRLGFVGSVNFCIGANSTVSVQHECLRIRETRQEAMEDARRDAEKLVAMWSDQVSIDDLH